MLLGREAFSANWYDSENRACEFQSVGAAILGSQFPIVRGANGGERFQIPKSSLTEVLGAPSGIIDKPQRLTDDKLRQLRSALESLRNTADFSSAAFSISGDLLDTQSLLGVGVGKLISYLESKADAKKLNMDRLIDFITLGGQYNQRIAFRSSQESFKPLIYVAREYQIQVGEEKRPRRWLFSACLLPVEVVLTEITTTAKGSNANNIKFLRQPDGTWMIWNIDDKKYHAPKLLPG
jgi:hypothetical protein